ncbi:hypothetical protein F5050DRAFT_111954 [Lentinula boryana]|uniref:Uncharacterized protein n=1 Tax=Lentinula boryana TaxID=40481 RepID=A0ABQ8QD81_9AGAR|nr:hypothetical protein F5050DRAFT_111954 [Lentinula boryana]
MPLTQLLFPCRLLSSHTSNLPKFWLQLLFMRLRLLVVYLLLTLLSINLIHARPPPVSIQSPSERNYLNGQKLYIRFACGHKLSEEDTQAAYAQLDRFLASRQVWKKLRLSKYRTPEDRNGLNLAKIGHPHPRYDKNTLHFNIQGIGECDGDCEVEILRSSPRKNFRIRCVKTGEVILQRGNPSPGLWQDLLTLTCGMGH